MMKHLMIAAAFCTGMLGAQAQSTPAKEAPAKPSATATEHPKHNCMTASDKEWSSLGLSAEAMEKVNSIQAACMKECGALMKDDPKLAMTMDKHEADVKGVLTAEQYDGWMKWCSTQAAVPAEKPTEKK